MGTRLHLHMYLEHLSKSSENSTDCHQHYIVHALDYINEPLQNNDKYEILWHLVSRYTDDYKK